MTTAATSDSQYAPSRTDRLDRLTFNRAHGKLLLGSGLGWALDAMDVGLLSFVIAALIQQGFATGDQASLLASIGFVGMAIGATLGGRLADRFGRRQTFALTLIVFGIATGASALAPSIAVLMVLRFFIGLGLGAELPVASTLVSEFSPTRIRGRMVVWLEAFWALGWILAALVGTYVVPTSEDGWRWALAIGMIPAIYAIVVRWGLPESVRFLESRGRFDEAEAAVREFERYAGTTPAAELIAQADRERDQRLAAEAAAQAREHGDSIWAPQLRRRTIGLWTIWFCINFSYYGAFLWIPNLLVDAGFELAKSFEFTLIITLAQLPGYAVAAWLIEVWGRRTTLATFLAGSMVSAAFFGLANTEAQIIIAGCLLSFFNLGAWGALYAIGPELYPTNIRGTGTGAAAGFGRIASILAPIVALNLTKSGGVVLTFTVFAVAFGVAAAAAFLLPEQRGKELAD